jgi:hypothetical protein
VTRPLVGQEIKVLCNFSSRWLAVALAGAAGVVAAQAGETIQEGEMAGHLLVPNDKVPLSSDAGFSLHVAAWPLLKEHPRSRFQTGLFGTSMFGPHEGRGPTNLYSDIEGGLGWWRDTRFATGTPKFIIGGVAPDFVEWANGPGAGKGRNRAKPSLGNLAGLDPALIVMPPAGLEAGSVPIVTQQSAKEYNYEES